MEGFGENHNGAGGHRNGADGRTKSMMKSMMNDLGLERLEDYAKDDDGRSRGDRHLAMPVNSGGGNNKWQSAVQNDAFDDDDKKAMKGLDVIGGGRLHAMRKESTNTGHSPSGLGQVRTAQSNGHSGASRYFGAPNSSYDPRNPQKRHLTPQRKRYRVQDHTHIQTTPNGALIPPGGEIFTFKKDFPSPASFQPPALPSKPLQLQPQPKSRVPTMFDAPLASSAPKNGQKRPAFRQEGSKSPSTQTQTSTIFPSTSVAGAAPLLPSSSGRANGNTSAPPQKRIKAILPHQRPSPGRSGVTASGSVSGVDVTRPSRSDLGQECSPATNHLARSTPERQESIRMIFESDITIQQAQRDVDGTIPTSGHVFLYNHPRNDGWTIWELQGNNDFVTRDDVREFIHPFHNGSTVIFRRLSAQHKVMATNRLLFPSIAAGQELMRLIEESKEQMDSINAPRFKRETIKVQKIGAVDLSTLLAKEKTTPATEHDMTVKHREDLGIKRVLPHERSYKSTTPVQASDSIKGKKNEAVENGFAQETKTSKALPEAMVNLRPESPRHYELQQTTMLPQKENHPSTEGNHPAASQVIQRLSNAAQHQEVSAPLLIDMKSPAKTNSSADEEDSPMLTKLIEIEADTKAKRSASEDLKGLTCEASRSPSIAEPAIGKKPLTTEVTRAPSQHSSRPTLDAVKRTESVNAKTSALKTLEHQLEPHSGYVSEVELLNTTLGGEDNADQNTSDYTGIKNNDLEANELDNEPEQSTALMLAPVHMTVQLHHVDGMLPGLDLSYASKKLVEDLAKKDYYKNLIESVEALYDASCVMGIFPDRRHENATFLAIWQSLYQNLTFRGFSNDEKLKTVACIYHNMHQVLEKRRVTYSLGHLMLLRQNAYLCLEQTEKVEKFNTFFKDVGDGSTTGYYRREDVAHVVSGGTQFLKPPKPTGHQALPSTSPKPLDEPGRLTPPPDLSEPQEKQLVGEETPVSKDGSDHCSSPITPAPSAAGETNTLGPKTDNIEKAIKQEDHEPVLRTRSTETKHQPPGASSSESHMRKDDASQEPQKPVKQEEASVVAHPQTPSPSTSAQNSEVPGNRTGSQGPFNVLPHLRGIRQNLGSAGLGGSRWAA